MKAVGKARNAGTIRDRSVKDYLDRLGEHRVAPCSGASAALCGAQASALALMVARSVTTKHRTPASSEFASVDICRSVASDFLDLAERDEAVVNLLIGEYTRPRNTFRTEAARSEAIEIALVGALETQAEIAPLLHRLLPVLVDLVPNIGPAMRADLGAAVELTRTALVIARLNIEANAALITGRDHLEVRQDEVSQLISTLARVEELSRII